MVSAESSDRTGSPAGPDATAPVVPGRASRPLLPTEQTEAYRELVSLAQGKTGVVPASLLGRHILAVTDGADTPVRREALLAILRRWGFKERDGLTVCDRPGGWRIFGTYRTRRKGNSKQRPYRSRVERLEPLRASCDCPDFVRNSLGLCKHVLAVLEDSFSRPRRLAKAIRDEAPPAVSRARRLWWHPVRPLRGPGDILEQVRWTGPDESKSGKTQDALCRLFERHADGSWRLRTTHPEKTRSRLKTVRELLGRARRDESRETGSEEEGGREEPSDPALLAVLEHERSRLERLERIEIPSRAVTAMLRTLRTKLYPYQRDGVRTFLSRDRLLLADDMGLGKTAQAIAACHVLWRLEKVKRGLVIVPASLKAQWSREWSRFSDVPLEIVDGSPTERRKAILGTGRGMLLMNYEQILRDLEVVLTWSPDIVVLDEAQRIKNWATKTAMYVKLLRPAYRLVLTGTPMENRLDELASIFDWIDDFALEPKWRLGPWHAIPTEDPRRAGGARNLDTLRERLAGRLVRRGRQEVLEQLPPRTDTRIPVELTPEQREEHDALSSPIAGLLRRVGKRALSQPEFLRLMQLLNTQRMVSNGLAQVNFEDVWPGLSRMAGSREAILPTLGSPKLSEFRELARHVAVEQGRKLVVFSQWRRMLRLAHWAVEDLLAERGLRGAFFTGEERQKRRARNMAEFHEDPTLRIFFASDAGGVGLNLQRAASCCVHLEIPWNPAVIEQRVGRIYRLGQTDPVDVYYLVSESGIESRLSSLVASKRALFTSLFDGTSDSVRFESAGSFLESIQRVVDIESLSTATRQGASAFANAEESPAAEREIDALLEAADEARPTPVEAAESQDSQKSRPVPAADVESLRRLIGQLEARRSPEGGLILEAPPRAAEGIATLLEEIARLLREGGKRANSGDPEP